MIWLVACLKVALVFDHAQHLDALTGSILILEQRLADATLGLLEGGGEHRMASTVGLIDAR
ncbi:hypothetical protein D3C84_1174420 [compost metagenome]